MAQQILRIVGKYLTSLRLTKNSKGIQIFVYFNTPSLKLEKGHRISSLTKYILPLQLMYQFQAYAEDFQWLQPVEVVP